MPASRLIRACVVIGSAVVGLLLIFAALGRPSVSQPAPAASVEPRGSATGSRPTPEATPGRAEPHAGRTRTQAGQRVIRDRISGPRLPESDPLTVAIPRIDVRSPLVRLGLGAGGELEVPQNPARAGWFTEGAAPGALGPAVIAGHVTWNGVPAVFYRLGRLQPGDQVTVDRSDGRTAVFTVNRVDQFPKSRFPTKAVYGPIDH